MLQNLITTKKKDSKSKGRNVAPKAATSELVEALLRLLGANSKMLRLAVQNVFITVTPEVDAPAIHLMIASLRPDGAHLFDEEASDDDDDSEHDSNASSSTSSSASSGSASSSSASASSSSSSSSSSPLSSNEANGSSSSDDEDDSDDDATKNNNNASKSDKNGDASSR